MAKIAASRCHGGQQKISTLAGGRGIFHNEEGGLWATPSGKSKLGAKGLGLGVRAEGGVGPQEEVVAPQISLGAEGGVDPQDKVIVPQQLSPGPERGCK